MEEVTLWLEEGEDWADEALEDKEKLERAPPQPPSNPKLRKAASPKRNKLRFFILSMLLVIEH